MIGSVLQDKYLVQELLGEGGMGVVYKALEQDLDRPVALMFLKVEFSDNPDVVKRFRDELKVLATFNHPNITTLYTSFSWQGRPVMVMELLDGETFSAMIGRRGPIPANICIPWVQQALAGVAEAHKRGIIHRDLKPANLMLTSSGTVKVMDFGIAKIESAPGLTRTTATLGTPYYMSPEQVDPTRFGLTHVDSRTDVYSMGITVYELLAGILPFQGATDFSIQRAHLEQQPQPPTIYYPHIPPPIVKAVLRAMAKDPRERFQRAEDFARALDAVASAAPVIAPPHEIESWEQTREYSDAPPAREHPPAAVPTTPPAATPSAYVPPPAYASPPASAYVPPPAYASPPASPVTGDRSPSASPTGKPAQPQPANALDALLQRWFGYTGRPRLAGAAVALLLALVLGYSGFAIFVAMNPARGGASGAHTAAFHPADAGGGATGAIPSGGTDSNSEPAAEPPLPTPSHQPAAPANTNVPAKPVAPPRSSQTAPTPSLPAPHQAPVPQPAPTVQKIVAGTWSGSFKSCEDSKETSARMEIAETPQTDPQKLYISGQLQLAAGAGSQSCAIKGIYTQTGNRMTLWASCPSGSAPAFLAAPHASVLSLFQDRLTGTVNPDTPCVIVEFQRTAQN